MYRLATDHSIRRSSWVVLVALALAAAIGLPLTASADAPCDCSEEVFWRADYGLPVPRNPRILLHVTAHERLTMRGEDGQVIAVRVEPSGAPDLVWISPTEPLAADAEYSITTVDEDTADDAGTPAEVRSVRHVRVVAELDSAPPEARGVALRPVTTHHNHCNLRLGARFEVEQLTDYTTESPSTRERTPGQIMYAQIDVELEQVTQRLFIQFLGNVALRAEIGAGFPEDEARCLYGTHIEHLEPEARGTALITFYDAAGNASLPVTRELVISDELPSSSARRGQTVPAQERSVCAVVLGQSAAVSRWSLAWLAGAALGLFARARIRRVHTRT